MSPLDTRQAANVPACAAFDILVSMRLAILGSLMLARLIAETPIEHSNETRFQLDVQVPTAALQAMLPPGWTQNPAATGAAKDCNLRVIFIDRVTINDPKGPPIGKGSNRLVWLAAPVKDPSGKAVQMIVGGITSDTSDSPGPFGNYLLAKNSKWNSTLKSDVGGVTVETQEWDFTAQTGERLSLSVSYERGPANYRPVADTLYYSAKDPSVYQISRQDQVLDILRNVTTKPPDRVKSFSFKAGGGAFSKLFDGTEKMLSWDNVLWLNRTVLKP
jgi:hypothetical protein